MKNKTKQAIQNYLLLTPALFLSLCLMLVPAVSTIFTSLTDWNGISDSMKWVGVENYISLFGNSTFKKALGNTVRWMLLYVSIPVLIAMIASICILRRRRSRTAFQVMFLLPYVIAPIANALIWLNMIYSPVTGLFGFLNETLGWKSVVSPITDSATALGGVAAVDIWHYWGYLVVIFAAALRQTPQDQMEAAVMDGCNGVQLFRYVYFPSILPTFKLMIVMIVIQSFLQFDYVYLLTKGGPAHATEMLGTLTYSFAFNTFQFGKAAAVAVIMSLLGLVVSVIYARMIRSESQR